MIHLDPGKLLFHALRTLSPLRPGDNGCRHLHDFSPNDWTRIRGIEVGPCLPLQAQAFDGLLAAPARFFKVRSLVHDGGVLVGDVGHVDRLINNGDVAFDRDDGPFHALIAQLTSGHEAVLIGANVIIIVGPAMNAAAAFETRFRRQGRPAHVVIARAPGNPGGRPFIAGNPDPADAAQAGPAPVVIGGPAKRFLRDPGPTGIGVNPAAKGIGTPVARFQGHARLPDVSVI